MSAITPNARNHEGLNAKDSRFVDVPDLPWEDTKFPGVKVKTLLVDESSGLLTVLLKMDPGARLPRHEHVLIEQTYVIDGEQAEGPQLGWSGEFLTCQSLPPTPDIKAGLAYQNASPRRNGKLEK